MKPKAPTHIAHAMASDSLRKLESALGENGVMDTSEIAKLLRIDEATLLAAAKTAGVVPKTVGRWSFEDVVFALAHVGLTEEIEAAQSRKE